MASKKTNAAEGEQHWLSIVQRWQNSGLEQVDFCRREGIEVRKFYAWRAKLQKKQLLAVNAGVMEPGVGSGSAPSKFVPMHIKPAPGVRESSSERCRLEIVTPGGYVVRIP